MMEAAVPAEARTFRTGWSAGCSRCELTSPGNTVESACTPQWQWMLVNAMLRGTGREYSRCGSLTQSVQRCQHSHGGTSHRAGETQAHSRHDRARWLVVWMVQGGYYRGGLLGGWVGMGGAGGGGQGGGGYEKPVSFGILSRAGGTEPVRALS